VREAVCVNATYFRGPSRVSKLVRVCVTIVVLIACCGGWLVGKISVELQVVVALAGAVGAFYLAYLGSRKQ
jgi:hypothetical protein